MYSKGLSYNKLLYDLLSITLPLYSYFIDLDTQSHISLTQGCYFLDKKGP